MVNVLQTPLPLTGGIKLADNRAASLEKPLARAKLPQLVILPLSEYEGSVAKPIVSIGDTVFKGQVIAKADDEISAPVYASTSGKVKDINEVTLVKTSEGTSTKKPSKCIVIETDGEDKWCNSREQVDDYNKLTPTEVSKRIIKAGVIDRSALININSGLSEDISLLIINAAETEPYISCHEAIIRAYIDDVIKGIEILVYALQVDACVITVEEDKTEIIEIIKKALSEKTNADVAIELKLISSLYPANEQTQLIKSITGQQLSFEASSVDAGIMIENISTAYAVKKAIIDAEPLTSRIVTVNGSGIKQPCNLEVILGTPINEIIEQCDGYTEQFEFLVWGGPMTGVKLDDDWVPLTKAINCLFAFSNMQVSDIKEETDVTCHDCEEVCPVNLKPHELHEHIVEKNENALIDSGLFQCIECGCCNYVCANHIQLMQEFREAKSVIRQQQHKRLEAKQNKKRYLNKLARKAKQEEEKTKRRQKKVVNNKDDELKKKKDVIAAAVNRVREKRAEKDNLK
ncbi:MAG: electron transport complex subunit RsxC [Gammaproteobacteria bacterium]|jgi:electron transport complex protein RnfC